MFLLKLSGIQISLSFRMCFVDIKNLYFFGFTRFWGVMTK